MSDRRLLYASVVLRSLSIGALGVLLSFHLVDHGFDQAQIGAVASAGLWGMAAATLGVGVVGDRWGRRRVLAGLALLSAGAVFAVAHAPSPWISVAAAFFGMLNAAGRDRGALPALEQSVLATTVTDAERTQAFAYYNVFDDGGLALGALSVWFAKKAMGPQATEMDLHEGGVVGAALLLVPCALLYLRLSPRTESAEPLRRVSLSPLSRKRVARIAGLFAIDAIGGGFLAAVFLALFFQERFGAGVDVVALLFAGARVLNAFSHLGAAWLARRIGLLNTMVFTHAPSSLLLLTVTIAPSLPVAAALFLLREGLVEMDVPTRQSYVMAIVRPEERTTVSAITNLVRMACWALAALLAGRWMKDISIVVPLVASAVLKLTYDVLLYLAFRSTKPPEEGGQSVV